MHRRLLVIFCLILAGEAIFSLPFHVPRFFRATVLEVFAFSNADLGDVFAVYGVTAMLAYFPGGAIADRFSARNLMSFSLIATATGGLYMATVPGVVGMSALFAYWGVTSILLFWAALIRSTREWGGDLSQGRAFGILDGGRGLVAAGLASVAVIIFKTAFESELEGADPAVRQAALVSVIYFYTAVTFAAGVVTWLLIPNTPPAPGTARRSSLFNIRDVLRHDVVWIQALIVVCAYCGYKGLDNYALYAVEVLGMNEIDAAAFTAASAYIRPAAAVAAGLLADRFSASRVMLGFFLILSVSYGYLGFATPVAEAGGLLFANILVSFAGVYGLRGVYFALLQETRVPPGMTGTAVGLISLVGYTPDVFFAVAAGRLLDNSPGVTGHQHYFLLLTAIMAVGTVTVGLLMQRARRRTKIKHRMPTA